jgi:hypothetical protein
MCGGRRRIAARSDDVVSPVLTAAVIRGASPPEASASCLIPRRGFQRRYVNDSDFIWQRRCVRFTNEIVDRRQKCSERLSGSCGRGDERVAALTDRFPTTLLRDRRFSKCLRKPARDQRMKRGQGHPRIITIRWM